MVQLHQILVHLPEACKVQNYHGKLANDQCHLHPVEKSAEVRLALLVHLLPFAVHEIKHEQNQEDLTCKNEVGEWSDITVQPRHGKVRVRESSTCRQELDEHEGYAK